MSPLNRTRNILADLIRFPTVSSNNNDDLIQYINILLSELDVVVDIQSAPEGGKANLLARIGPDVPGGVVLSGHTDVVPVDGQDWASDPFEMREEDGRIYGRGSCDMKGFVAACLAMAPAFADKTLKTPIYFAFTYDEEVGCIGGQHLCDMLAARQITADAAIIGEPTEMRMIDGHKGCHEFAVDFTGDGRRDIWSEDPTDALASTAAYLQRNGWTRGTRWGREVTGAAAAGALQPQPGGPSFAVTGNFKAIKRYNNSDAYAIGVGHLADRIAGGPPLRGKFPPDANGLTKDDRVELQKRLTAKGFDTDGADGVLGPKSQAAISAYQSSIGLPATGTASQDLLRGLK